jgi:NADH:ubiquinone oxidoreductase subunit D
LADIFCAFFSSSSDGAVDQHAQRMVADFMVILEAMDYVLADIDR